MNLESLKRSVQFVKKALGSANGNTEVYTHYRIGGGQICASDGNIVATAPIELDAELLVPSQPFEAALGRLPSDPKVKIEDGKVMFRAGKMSCQVLTLDPSTYRLDHVGLLTRTIDLDERFHYLLKTLSSFVEGGHETNWMSGFAIADGLLMTTNRGFALLVADYPAVEGLTAVIPRRAVEFLSGKVAPVRMEVYSNGTSPDLPCALRFHYQDGFMFRTNLVAGAFPADKLKSLFGLIEKPDFELTADWKAAYERVASLSTEEVIIYRDKICGDFGKVHAEEEIESPVPDRLEKSVWNPKVLSQIVKHAKWWSPAGYPRASFCCEDGIRGLVMGKTI